MPLSGFFDAIGQVAKFSRRWDDDFCDRLNHRFSCLILITMTVIVSYKQYVGEPIVCWCDGTWTGPMVDYAHQICWISNTYYLAPELAPLKSNEPREAILVYYQWVPFILVTQAFLFQLPNCLWKGTSQLVGMDLNRLSQNVSGMENINPEIRDRTVRAMVKQMDRALAVTAWRNNGACNRCLQTANIGSNSLGQIFALNYVLGTEGLGVHFFFYGLNVFRLATSKSFVRSSVSKVFPRVTMCDFTVRQMGNLHTYTVECALPINLFNEKIFFFLWCWLLILTVLNLFSLIFWISSMFSLSRTSYIKKYLLISERMRRAPIDRNHLSCFSQRYLRQDGVFAIKMLARNTNDVIVSEVVCKLWDNFMLHHRQRAEFHKNHPIDVDLELAKDSRLPNGRPNRLPTKNSESKSKTPTTPGNIFP
ncbi:innexin unc-9-like [Watersipora subatra]|uniref:innexin unc-9-like n=1 Tax=Watersipora subatra TaxID=2589382 RepID=UPI00355B13A5